MSANPHANGGLLTRELELPDFRDYAVEVASSPGTTSSEATRVLGGWLRDVMQLNRDRFRIMGPDETASNRLGARVRGHQPDVGRPRSSPPTTISRRDGRVMEVLSEHLCQGWLEGYLLTGRHGLFNCYEAFIHIVDSMFNQHAKWLKVTRNIPWRRPIPSLNYLLSSHVWRQDHNGFSHQDPGFIDHVVNKSADIIRVYLPPDANCLLSVADHCLRSRHYVNVIVAGKQPALDYLTMDEAIAHCTRGLGIWEWASNDAGEEPDVVLACAGDIPTLETLSAAGDPARAAARAQGPGGQRRRPDAAAARGRAPARHAAPRVRRAVHDVAAGDLRLPRLPVADPPPHLPPGQPSQHPRARLQGGGHHHDAVRHGDAQRPRPLPPGDRRDRPGAGARGARRPPAPGDGRRAAAPPRLHPRGRRRRSGRPRLDLAGVATGARPSGGRRVGHLGRHVDTGCGSSSSTRARAPSSCRCSGPTTTRWPSESCRRRAPGSTPPSYGRRSAKGSATPTRSGTGSSTAASASASRC